MRKLLVIPVAIALTATSAPAQQKECGKDLTDADKELLSTFYYYSFLQEWAFQQDTIPEPVCDLPTPDYSALDMVTLRELNGEIRLHDIFESDELPYAAVYQESRMDGQNRFFISCHHEEVIPQLAVNIRMVGPRTEIGRDADGVERNIDYYDANLDVAIAVPESILNTANKISQDLSMEQIEVTHLYKRCRDPIFPRCTHRADVPDPWHSIRVGPTVR